MCGSLLFFSYFCIVFLLNDYLFMKQVPLFALSLLLLAGCVGAGSPKGDVSETDSLGTVAPVSAEVLLVDTVCGFVGDGTSMNVIELVNTDATDTTYLDVSDLTSMRATLEVGNQVRALVCREADGSLSLLSITDVNP